VSPARALAPRFADLLTLSHDGGHIWRALLESYVYAMAHHIETLNDIGHRTDRYLVSDSGSNSRVWMRIVADVPQKPIQRPTGHSASCLGAVRAAADGAGLADAVPQAIANSGSSIGACGAPRRERLDRCRFLRQHVPMHA
jgi:sugar (pentulose or hexulose) kinase